MTGIYGGGATTFPGSPAGTLPGTTSRLFVARFPGNNLALCNWQTHGGYSGTAAASGYSDGMGIAVNPSGAFCYVTAYFVGIANFGNNGSIDVLVTDAKNPTSNGQLNDYLIAKLLTSDGTPVWAINGGGNQNSDDEPRAIAVDRIGNPYITGFRHPFAPLTGTPYVNEGPTMLVASFDSATGAPRWTRNAIDGFGLPNLPQDVGFGIAVNGAGCVHVTGAFTEDLQFPPVGLPVATLGSIPSNLRDMFVAKMCPTCSCDGQNRVVNGSFETPVVTPVNSGGFSSAVPGWTGTGSGGAPATIELWNGTFGSMTPENGQQHLEISGAIANETVSQVVAGLKIDCAATFCFWYVGRPGFANNLFTARLTDPSGGIITSETLNPAVYVAPGSWQQYCVDFVPTTSTVTIAFTNISGAAHIDNVSLTQCCGPDCVLPPVIHCAPDKTVCCFSGESFDTPTATDPCTGESLPVTTVSTTVLSGSWCDQVTKRIWQTTGPSGGTATCSQTITVVWCPKWLITKDTVWTYLTNGLGLTSAWKDLGYDDSSWPSGAALFGFATNQTPYLPWIFRTPIAPPGQGGEITAYYRTHFSWTNTTGTVVLTATNQINDGAVFFLNGVEVGRLRVPPNQDSATLATRQPNEGVAEVLTFSAANLQAGENVLAVEVHQASAAGDNEVAFGMELSAAISTATSNPGPLQIVLSGNNVVISWTGAGTLQQADSLNPPVAWTDVTSTSPYTTTALGSKRFFRVRFGPPGGGSQASGLTVSAGAFPNPVVAGNNTLELVTVQNNGTNAASSVRLTNGISAALVFLSADASQGSCTFTSAPVSVSAFTPPLQLPTDAGASNNTRPASVIAVDLDGDGRLDLVSANSQPSGGSSFISVFPNISVPGALDASAFAPRIEIAAPAALDVVAADFDGDGRTDLAFVSIATNGPMVILLRNISTGPGDIRFEPPVVLVGTGGGYAIAVGDFNQDGKPDLAIVNENRSSIYIFENRTTGPGLDTNSFGPPIEFAVGLRPRCLAVGDLDGDGWPEIVVGHDGINAVALLSNLRTPALGTNSFGPATLEATPTTISSLVIADFTGDGINDVIVSRDSVSALAVADLDGDGKLDLAELNQVTGQVTLFANTSTGGSFSLSQVPGTILLASNTPTALRLVLADLDRNGQPDLIGAVTLGDSLAVVPNTTLRESICDLGSLAPGASATVTLTLGAPNPVSAYLNSTAASAEFGFNPTNNQVITLISVVQNQLHPASAAKAQRLKVTPSQFFRVPSK